MNQEERARRQSRRVIISEIIMLLAVIATVCVLVFLVSGYWLNSDFEVERQGLLQVSSFPTGASVTIDGESSWLQRTNTSKVLTAGEHTIVLTKDEYDSWSKTINVKEGLLYGIHYPRLFLKDRTKEKVLDVTAATFATVSPNRNRMLIANATTDWKLINLENNKLEPRSIDISKVFPGTGDSENSKLFTGEIISADWDGNSEHILFKVKYNDAFEWVILDIRDPKNSVNITRTFAANFDQIKIFDSSASTLLAVRDGNLHKIDLSSRQISAILVEKIHSFDHFESEIVFVADYVPASSSPTNDENESTNTATPAPYYLGLVRLGDSEATTLSELEAPAKVTISKFYDDKYISVLSDANIKLYKKDEFKEVLSSNLTFSPATMKVGRDGNFVTMSRDAQIATLDMEAMAVREWQATSPSFGWLDDNMIYSVADGTLTVYDFDGQNGRQLSSNVSSHFPVTITSDKWLYYFSDGSLVREIIAK
ncbi:PEGA domain-containing protein [Candidatus Saccharibacteria bacterium]|nr:PEGA domain-containing protein [Candidatus Saccharibacteria bacterium]